VASSKNLGWSVDCASDFPVALFTDPQRLGQILRNLLANAFKFTAQGQVQLRLWRPDTGWDRSRASLASAPSVIALSVTDTGIGIDKAEQHRVFEAFAQADGSTSRRYGGTGLGLSISRELAGLLGGEIALESAAGQGSTFTVFLPHTLPPTDPRDHPLTQDAIAEPLFRQPLKLTLGRVNGFDGDVLLGMTVLVVDDDFRNLFALTALLERGRAEVLVAESGLDALEVLGRRSDVDLILMDIMMPVMDGYAAMTAIRKIDELKEIPIVVITGKVMAGERQRCIDAGADGYVIKPIDMGELVAAIEPWLKPVTRKDA
jgi:two-component system chemotaxis sensor kinase CheA